MSLITQLPWRYFPQIPLILQLILGLKEVKADNLLPILKEEVVVACRCLSSRNNSNSSQWITNQLTWEAHLCSHKDNSQHNHKDSTHNNHKDSTHNNHNNNHTNHNHPKGVNRITLTNLNFRSTIYSNQRTSNITILLRRLMTF